MTVKLQGIRGMEDVLPDASPLREKLEEACRTVCRSYGYRNIRTPIVEPTALFVRGLGEVTDIVEKEMYVFEDRNGESLALRPEATAGIVRSAIEFTWSSTFGISSAFHKRASMTICSASTSGPSKPSASTSNWSNCR